MRYGQTEQEIFVNININIVECKSLFYGFYPAQHDDININIVECKW